LKKKGKREKQFFSGSFYAKGRRGKLGETEKNGPMGRKGLFRAAHPLQREGHIESLINWLQKNRGE